MGDRQGRMRALKRNKSALELRKTDSSKREGAGAASSQGKRPSNKILDSVLDAVSIHSQSGELLRANEAMLALLGVSGDEARSIAFGDLAASPSLAAHLPARWLKALGGESVRFEWKMKRPRDGALLDVEVFLKKAELPTMDVVVVTVRDRTVRGRLEAQLKKFSRAVEQSPATVIITDTQGTIEYVNPKFTALTGYSFDEVMGQNPRILKSGETRPEVYRELWKTICAGKEWRGEFHNKKRNGELYWESGSISPIVEAGGVVTHFVGVKEDITARKAFEQELIRVNRALEEANRELERLSVTDGLTGIANRRYFDRLLEIEWERARRTRESIALIMADIDYFKPYNDHDGHLAGDECLRRVSAALRDCLRRSSDLVARYGGDEFAVLLPVTRAEGSRHVAELIQRRLTDLRLEHRSSPISDRVTMSIGAAATVPQDGQICSWLIEAADACLYEAKRQGRNQVRIAREGGPSAT
jgi:diguanylate cyclase (GGDEF)-like protein/PAS domain S-box-containing protein